MKKTTSDYSKLQHCNFLSYNYPEVGEVRKEGNI